MKQAQQVRYCLIQAEEYYIASKQVSLSTRPLLLYYSIMSLALVQLLFKGSGLDSLDAARNEHSHHGLQFVMSGASSISPSFEESSRRLTAKPMIRLGQRIGTFELWHRTAREYPVAGPFEAISVNHSRISASVRSILIPDDRRIGFLAEHGISFLECLTSLPGMHEWFTLSLQESHFIRGHIRALRDDISRVYKQNLTIHPAHPDRMLKIVEGIKFKPSDLERVSIQAYDSGFEIEVHNTTESTVQWHIPAAVTWTNEEIRFLPNDAVLNEFGYLYIGLFMIGNYARYYPDLWMKDVERSSPLAEAVDVFMDLAEWRMALLTLSELSQAYYVCES